MWLITLFAWACLSRLPLRSVCPPAAAEVDARLAFIEDAPPPPPPPSLKKALALSAPECEECWSPPAALRGLRGAAVGVDAPLP